MSVKVSMSGDTWGGGVGAVAREGGHESERERERGRDGDGEDEGDGECDGEGASTRVPMSFIPMGTRAVAEP